MNLSPEMEADIKMRLAIIYAAGFMEANPRAIQEAMFRSGLKVPVGTPAPPPGQSDEQAIIRLFRELRKPAMRWVPRRELIASARGIEDPEAVVEALIRAGVLVESADRVSVRLRFPGRPRGEVLTQVLGDVFPRLERYLSIRTLGRSAIGGSSTYTWPAVRRKR